MIFELISWAYISLVCLISGNWFLKVVFGVQNISVIDFPVICFIGMSVFGIMVFYLSLVVPLFPGIKLGLQGLTLLTLMKRRNRKEIYSQFEKYFSHFKITDIAFLAVSIVMVLIISSAPVIHPDTLNYHAFSAQIFDLYGTIPGIANLKPGFGFQSMWFAVLAFFHFSFSDGVLIYPLNSCVTVWVIVMLVSRAVGDKNTVNGQNTLSKRIWYLVLILFAIFSWTQIRLTASSLSPDFIATISILLAFYFFAGVRGLRERKKSDLIAIFFSAVAFSLKLSAVPVLLLPCIIVGYWLRHNKYLVVVRIGLLLTLLLTPILIRNVISSGYAVYPSTFADFNQADWKVEKTSVLDLQKYITAYARYPILNSHLVREYNKTMLDWIPLWWNHLYFSDQVLIVLIVFGVLINIFFLRTVRSAYSPRLGAGLFVAMTGTVFWFVNAPDPRFGTGFLIPLVYFLYFPFVEHWVKNRIAFMQKVQNILMKLSTLLILIYIGYRGVYFFQPRQWIFPEGIKQISNTQDDCDANIKRMVLHNTIPLRPLADSCMFFRFRGTTIKQGFKPVQ